MKQSNPILIYKYNKYNKYNNNFGFKKSEIRSHFYRKNKAEIWVDPELKHVMAHNSRQNVPVYGNFIKGNNLK